MSFLFLASRCISFYAKSYWIFTSLATLWKFTTETTFICRLSLSIIPKVFFWRQKLKLPSVSNHNFTFLTGSRPESSDGSDQPQYQNGNPPLLLDPMAINMMPPEYDKPVTKKPSSMIEKMANGLSKLHLNGNTFGPKGSLVWNDNDILLLCKMTTAIQTPRYFL